MESLALILTDHGVAFTMRLVRRGERYGLKNCLTHDKADPLVEFYDSRYPFDLSPAGTVLGQFVSRYSAATLLEGTADRGLCLDGVERAWTLDAKAFAQAQAMVRLWLVQIAEIEARAPMVQA